MTQETVKIRSHWCACQWGYAPHYSYQEPSLTPVAHPLPAASHPSSLSPPLLFTLSICPFPPRLPPCIKQDESLWSPKRPQILTDYRRATHSGPSFLFFFLATFLSPKKCQLCFFFFFPMFFFFSPDAWKCLMIKCPFIYSYLFVIFAFTWRFTFIIFQQHQADQFRNLWIIQFH